MKVMKTVPDLSRGRRLGLVMGLSALALTACGGGSGDGSGGGSSVPGGGPATLIPPGGSRAPASEVGTGDLQRIAAGSASRGIGANTSGVQNVLNDSAAISAGLGAVQRTTGAGGDGTTGESEALFGVDGFPDIMTGDMTAGIGSLLDASLGLRGPAATSERTGDRITIDPDDAALCDEELLGMNSTQADFDLCLALVADLSVTIDAASDDSGIVSYLFLGEPLLLIGYAPMAASYELKLGGVGTLLARVEELESGSVGDLPAVLEGAVRAEFSVASDVAGAEAGSVSLLVTEALRIVDDTDGTDISLAPSTLLTLESDAAAGTASITTDIGALRATLPDEDDFGNPSLITLAMSGATSRIDLIDDGDVLRVSNFGLRQGPLTLSIDSMEALRLVMDTFGFSVDGEAGRIAIDSAMNLDLDVGNLSGLLDDAGGSSSLSLGLAAPGGTSLLTLEDSGTLQVSSGGPLQIRLELLDGETAVNDDISVQAGQCVGADQSGAGLLAAVSCP